MSCGRSSLKTPHSRMRRAISCEYWPPKWSTRTSSVAWAGAVLSTSRSSGSAPGTDRSGTWTRAWVSSEAAFAASVIRDADCRGDRGAPVGAHADRLLALELLALGHQGGRDHHLGAVEFGDIRVAGGRHRGPQRAHQVEGPVVVLGRTQEDLLERAVLVGGHPGAAGQRRMEGRHAPVEASAGSLLGTRQR